MILKGSALHRSEAENAGPPPTDTGPREFDFRSHRPAHPLGRLVESIWYARGRITCALARLLRMRRLLAGIDVRGEVDWSDRAAELGWFDQAHLIRDFKRHTGVPPSRYLAAQRAAFSANEIDDAVGFVPER